MAVTGSDDVQDLRRLMHWVYASVGFAKEGYRVTDKFLVFASTSDAAVAVIRQQQQQSLEESMGEVHIYHPSAELSAQPVELDGFNWARAY